jgi:hypothetical protein
MGQRYKKGKGYVHGSLRAQVDKISETDAS